MKPALVLVDHGSQREAANAVLDQIAGLIRSADPHRTVATAHMELASPTLAEAVAACVAAGASEIIVVPYFLGPGRHTSEDIPRLCAEAAAQHPDVDVRMAAALGPHPKLAELALLRAEQAS
jgi:sirohydrochlorin ferrochelatase